MIRSVLVALICLVAASAFAQQPAPPPSALENALSDRLMVEIQANVQARAALIEMQRKLAAAEARIKELEGATPKANK